MVWLAGEPGRWLALGRSLVPISAKHLARAPFLAARAMAAGDSLNSYGVKKLQTT